MNITVVVPVGPFASNKRWLPECLESIKAQTRQPDELILIDDMADLGPGDLMFYMGEGDRLVSESSAEMGHTSALADWAHGGGCAWHLDRPFPERGVGVRRTVARVWRAPWRLGVAQAFNMGVALSAEGGVFMLGSDDEMLPNCLEQCEKAWAKEEDPGGCYFWVGVHYLDEREDPNQFTPCNTAMVSPDLWRRNGGYPPEAGSGACDAALISAMMVHREAGKLVCVNHDQPLANYRPHGETDTAGRAPWQGIILATRDILTTTWTKPEWGRSQ